jgi:HEXXH motif-containing protein
MSDLIARIKSSLEDINGPPWFPDLTAALVQTKWQELTRTIGLRSCDYRTSRVLSVDSNAPCEVAQHFPICLDDSETNQTIAIELLTGDLLRQYEGKGIRFYSGKEIAKTSVLDCVREALAILSLVPTLQLSVATLVKALHIIKPENEDYDISFSEPHIPFSIFVSVPERRAQADALRVAEAIIHEAMHLQLTLIERFLPLVKFRTIKHYSPWRRELRNAQGVLHGLYVFCVIEEFLNILQSLHLHGSDMVGYIDGRLSEIHDQVDGIQPFQDCEDLAETGTTFTRRLMAGLNRNGAGGIV